VCFTKPAFLVCPDSFSHQIELVTEILKRESFLVAYFERNQLTDFDSSSVSVTSYALIEIP
jgi:hypothetical protein